MIISTAVILSGAAVADITPLAGLVTLVVAVIGLFGVMIGVLFNRIGKLERDLGALRGENHRLWRWARKLLDYAYRHRMEGAPEPPEYEDTLTHQEG